MAGVAAIRRHLPIRGRRLVLCAAVIAAAVVVGGGIAVLLAVMTVLLVLDAVVPLPDGSWSEADQRFRGVVRRRRRAHQLRRLRGLEPERLELLDDQTGWASVAERRELGVLAIPVDSVIGTVEGYKAATFNRALRPDRSCALHWKQIWMAGSRGIPLPPISVYRVGAGHFLRDGHHRVSVWRDLGRATIEAEVVELLRPRAG